MYEFIFSHQLWVNSRADWAHSPWYCNWPRRKEISLKIDLVFHPAYVEVLGIYIYIYIYIHHGGGRSVMVIVVGNEYFISRTRLFESHIALILRT